MSSDDQSAESFHGEDDFNKKKLESLKNLRENINWKVKKERNELLGQLYPLISDWTIEISDLRSIFRSKEINWLLIEELKNLNEFFDHITELEFITRNYDRTRYQWKLLDFVNQTGYKDEPEVNRDGKPLLRRTTPLHHVSRFNNWTKLRPMLRDPNIIPIIRKLFNIYNRFDLNYIDDFGCTHFHVACEYGLEDVVQKFLELGQDPNLLVQKKGNSPLYLALSHDKRKVSRLLLKHGADPNVANKDGRTPLHVLGKNYWNSPDMEMIFELKKKLKPGQVDARDKLGNTPLHLAVSTLYSNANHVIRALLEIGANPNVANDDGLTPMHIICKRCCNDGLRELFCQISDDMKQPVQLDARDKLGNTPLHLAALLNDYKSLEFLLKNGADPNAVNEEGLTPLHMIAKTEVFCTLAKTFFKINKEFNQLVQVDARDKLEKRIKYRFAIPIRSHTYISFEHRVFDARTSHNVTVGEFSNTAPARTSPPALGTPTLTVRLHVRVELRKNSPTLRAFFFKLFRVGLNKFDLNYIDDLGCTHFHVACEYGLEDVVQKFLELGQDPNLLVQKTGNSPLYLALSHDIREVSRLLLKHGADPNVANKDGRTPLHVVGKNYWNSPDMEMIFELKKKLKPGQVDARDKLGNTPLHLAVPSLFSNVKLVAQALLEIGANPNVANNEGLTPMHIICKRRCFDGLRELFCQISDVRKQPVQLDARDKLGNTPLHMAALWSLDNHLRWLLRIGADPNAVNNEGLTPLHIFTMTDRFCTLARAFFNTNKELNQLVQVDARDKLEEQVGGADKKVKRKSRKESFGIYLYKVLKQVHPDTGVSSKVMSIMNSLVNDIFECIATEASRLAAYSKKSTITSREIQTAVGPLLLGELVKHAISEGTKSVTKDNIRAYFLLWRIST
ncbi:unnamed protein product [Trichogramma brassicae]|uniref:Core Histone H2A/H2B/H3 domain-containing protein n=1 Tax=Trichogramma brassicae TaxID=86971 RepID=A0A6H5IFL0_9HYME|nr:unnamed protein product [Trichogramma brassicae]